jgi:hypothetical protein
MARRTPRLEATHEKTLTPLKECCEQCGQPLWVAYHGHRTVTTLTGLWKLTLVVRQCIEPTCPHFHQRYRPEEEGRWALPHGEFGLEVIALIGQWRFRDHRSVPEMHQALLSRGISVAQRSVTYLMQRYEELVTLRITDQERIKARLQKQGRVILAIDGLQPDVGHEVLWVVRDCHTARNLVSASFAQQYARGSDGFTQRSQGTAQRTCRAGQRHHLGWRRDDRQCRRFCLPRCASSTLSVSRAFRMPPNPSMKRIGMPKHN